MGARVDSDRFTATAMDARRGTHTEGNLEEGEGKKVSDYGNVGIPTFFLIWRGAATPVRRNTLEEAREYARGLAQNSPGTDVPILEVCECVRVELETTTTRIPPRAVT